MREVHQGCIGANHWKSSPSMAGQSGQYAITYNPHNLAHQASRNRPQWSLEEVKEDSIKLLKDVYVDDGTTGGSQRQVDRMLGSKMKDGNFSGTIP